VRLENVSRPRRRDRDHILGYMQGQSGRKPLTMKENKFRLLKRVCETKNDRQTKTLIFGIIDAFDK